MSMCGTTVSEQTLRDYLDFKMNNKFSFQLITCVKPGLKTLETTHLEPREEGMSNRKCWEHMKTFLTDEEALFVVFPLKFNIREGW